ncbi:MAG: hypothetical protein DMG64_16510, partial [Acidobacteria bacterium]
MEFLSCRRCKYQSEEPDHQHAFGFFGLIFTSATGKKFNPKNPIINTRSFGEDPQAVAAMVAAYIKGSRQNGMLSTAKHFPGHGDTATDSHLGVAMVSGDTR